MVRLALFGSGKGSNAVAILRSFDGHDSIRVAALASNKPERGFDAISREWNIPLIAVKANELNASQLEEKLTKLCVDGIVLAGFLHKIPENLTHAFPCLNIHPALLPKYGGKGMYGRHVHEAVIQSGDRVSGITIHEVTADYDQGRILFQKSCPILKGDDASALAKRIQSLEHKHYPFIVERYFLCKKNHP